MISKARERLFRLLALLILGVGAPTPSWASEGSTQPKMLVSLTPVRQSMSLHAPIMMDLKIYNQSSSSIEFDLGPNFKTHFRFRIINRAGEQQREVGSLPRPGFAALGSVSLAPGETHEQALVFDQWHRFSEVGEFGIRIEFDRDRLALEPSTTAIVYDQNRWISVEPRDEARLIHFAADLSRKAIQADAEADRYAAAHARSFLSDPLAGPALSAVLTRGRWSTRQYALEGLETIGTRDAVSAIGSVLADNDEDIRALAWGSLIRQERDVEDEELRTYIQQLMRETTGTDPHTLMIERHRGTR